VSEAILDPSPETASTSRSRANNMAGLCVLISDEHYKHSLAIVRHLGRKGVHVSIVATSKESLACRSRYCRKWIPARAAHVDALLDTMLETVKSEHFDLVMPVSYPLTLGLAARRSEFIPFTHVELVGRDVIELAANKRQMIDLAASLGIPVPRTVPAAEVEKHAGKLTFPVVIKPGKESPGRPPIRYARNWDQLRSMLGLAANTQSARHADDSLVQEFIPGYGCGLFASYQHGVCKRVFMHRRVREYPPTGGVSSCAESFYDVKLENHGRRMLDALQWHGIAMVEFRQDSRDGEYKLMEINPKFWGSLDLALAAGADFPGDLCRMAAGKTLTFTDEYDRNLRFQWPWSGHGDLFHLCTRPQSVFQVAFDFLNPKVKSNIWFSDFGPNLEELRSLSCRLLGGGKK
jgi:predicted ATP-grasp superfamily ATP-dependent carboligase